ncbi:MAG TPA: nitroreductase [Gaiellaceae bacterium]|nr:nitroreductase [Gaiellaceae bacterium]
MDVDDAIRLRRTHKQYGPTPVDAGTLHSLLELARWAPNHHLTQPTQLRVLGPETRSRLEQACGDKEAAKLRRAPTLVLATALLESGDPRTDAEDLHSTACAVYAILLAATARGLASYWRTPEALEGPEARAVLGLHPSEHVVGLIHLGPPASEPPTKERSPLTEVVRYLA